jgi:hypothetical protein
VILLDFIRPVNSGPRVWIDTNEVTDRCLSVELLPGAIACLHLIAEPMEVVKKHVDSGFGMGVEETELRKQVHSGDYTVLGCPGCDETSGRQPRIP